MMFKGVITSDDFNLRPFSSNNTSFSLTIIEYAVKDTLLPRLKWLKAVWSGVTQNPVEDTLRYRQIGFGAPKM